MKERKKLKQKRKKQQNIHMRTLTPLSFTKNNFKIKIEIISISTI